MSSFCWCVDMFISSRDCCNPLSLEVTCNFCSWICEISFSTSATLISWVRKCEREYNNNYYCSVPGKHSWALKHNSLFRPAWVLIRDINCIHLYGSSYTDPLKLSKINGCLHRSGWYDIMYNGVFTTQKLHQTYYYYYYYCDSYQFFCPFPDFFHSLTGVLSSLVHCKPLHHFLHDCVF